MGIRNGQCVRFAAWQQRQIGGTLQYGRRTVSVEFRFGQHATIDGEPILTIGHVECGHGRMMRNLFGNVKCSAAIFVLPIATKGFAQNGIVWFL